MRNVVPWSQWFRCRSDQRHYSHRYAQAIESLVDSGVFNDVVTGPSQAPRFRPKLVAVSTHIAPPATRTTRAEVA